MWDIYALICASIKFYWIEINHFAFARNVKRGKTYKFYFPVQNKCHSKSHMFNERLKDTESWMINLC